ncbi:MULTISPECIES: aspartate kinase [unclassified Vibrio]|uniref:aspartate kinase n=1 Tax=unclassified Vibrio TaxID=2614977 RepID=UPI001482EF4C|nr:MULTISPECIES: aspartate kinase [unclassified Vibrio]MDQ2192507.1 aspartate kinase [Vibrio sp. A14(2019)]MDQ2196472.1 aspartate kinase [Vibrio sp. 2017_1457_11]NNN75482.1 aspartate kinase [Vibrio sp. B7]NNN92272.1 aspartate kinase [Vibrio sp. B8-1]NNO07572.1 aspartate kinase [Vibrio sp. B4-12]
MSYTVEKIGGTSMSAFDAVLDNILLRPHHPYDRVFVVSAYATITDALLECKRTGKPGIYQMIAKHDTQWQEAMYQLEQRMLLINEHLFADPMSRIRADKFIRSRISEAVNCINNILETCQYGQFSLRQYLPQVREFLSSIGEAHSAYNTSLKLKTLGINACFIDLSGWNNGQAGSLDEVILAAFEDIDVATQLPIVTGYAYCNEGLMKTYDRGYSEMTFSRIAALTNATQAIIHKEYHLSSADPRIVGADKVSPMGLTNFDVADQLANLGMEAIHPNAAAGLRQQGIELRIKNTFEPEHKGTLISNVHKPQNNKVEIIAGKDKVFALHIFDQSMVGKIDNASYELMEVIAEAKVHLVGKEMNANSMTYYLSGSSDNLNHVLYKIEKRYPNASVSGKMVALISAIGASMNTNNALTQGMQALVNAKISPIAAHSSMRNVNVQFVVEDNDYNRAICVLHDVLIAKLLSTKKAA